MAQQITALEEVKSTLVKMQPEFKELLNKTGIDPDKFIRVAIMAVQFNPSLLECNRPSLYKAFTLCAKSGLLPDGQESVVTKFGGEAVFMDMIEGILKQCRNSGELATIDAQTVFEGDEYESWTDEKGSHFKHKKLRKSNVPILTYAYALTKDGAFYFEEVSEEQMKSIESIAKTKMVWQGPFRDEMRRKSALRRLSKRLPKSTDMGEIIARHDENFDISNAETVESQPATTSSRLSEAVAPQPQAEEAQTVPVTAPTTVTTPEPKDQSQQQAPEAKIAQGLIEKLDVKNSPEGSAKKWTKFGCKIGEAWYGTFDKTLWKKIEDFANQRVLVNLQYTLKVVGDKTYNEIVDVEAQVAGVDVPI